MVKALLHRRVLVDRRLLHETNLSSARLLHQHGIDETTSYIFTFLRGQGRLTRLAGEAVCEWRSTAMRQQAGKGPKRGKRWTESSMKHPERAGGAPAPAATDPKRRGGNKKTQACTPSNKASDTRGNESSEPTPEFNVQAAGTTYHGC